MTNYRAFDPSSINPTVPWLWFWLVTYIIGLPSLFSGLGDAVVNLRAFSETGSDVAIGSVQTFIEYIPRLSLFFGALLIFIPSLRAQYLQRKYQIQDIPDLPILKEITAFVKRHAPNIHIQFSINPQLLAFVYPIGYRKSAVVIGSGLVRQWQKERPSAETILRHEIAHYKHGDTLVIGAGSLFQVVTTYWLWAMLVVGALSGIVLMLKGASFFIIITGVFSGISLLITELLRIFLLPLLTIWYAELSADRFAVESSPKTGDGAFSIVEQETSWFQWVLWRMSHPPIALRKWFITAQRRTCIGLLALILLYPLAAMVVKPAALLLWALAAYTPSYMMGAKTLSLLQLLFIYMHTAVPFLFAIAILIILWPVLEKYWQKFFCGEIPSYNVACYPVYLGAGVGVGLVAALIG